MRCPGSSVKDYSLSFLIFAATHHHGDDTGNSQQNNSSHGNPNHGGTGVRHLAGLVVTLAVLLTSVPLAGRLLGVPITRRRPLGLQLTKRRSQPVTSGDLVGYGLLFRFMVLFG